MRPTYSTCGDMKTFDLITECWIGDKKQRLSQQCIWSLDVLKTVMLIYFIYLWCS